MLRIKKLTHFSLQHAGRNNQGRITVWHRGGGNKKLYRIIDFKRSLFNIPARVVQIQYDPNRTAKIACVCYQNGILAYILAPSGLQVGDIIKSGVSSDIVPLLPGNSLPAGLIPAGSLIHNVELKPGKGGQLIRAAGAYAKIIKKDDVSKKYIIIRLISGKLFSISPLSFVTLGVVSSSSGSSLSSLLPSSSPRRPLLRKAGQSRWKNRRPVVRGMAMNPVDHPHGGGQGKSKGGAHPVTPWGKLTKGKLTKPKNRKNLGFVLSHFSNSSSFI